MSEYEIAKKDLLDVAAVFVDEADDPFDYEADETIRRFVSAADKEIADLKTYCQHKPDCSYHNHGQQYPHGEGPIDCDCGLAQKLGLEVSHEST